MGLPLDVKALQTADRLVFVPVCWVLDKIRRLTEFPRPRGTPVIRSILFVKLAEQGSSVLARDAIDRAVRRVGREKVYFLVFEENRFILDLMNLVPPENIMLV